MSEVRRLIGWGLALMALTLVTIFAAVFILYQQAFESERQSLTDTVKTQAALIEAVAAFDRLTNPDWHVAEEAPEVGARAATLSQIRAAFRDSPGLGETGELVLGKMADGNPVVIVHQRAHAHDRDHQIGPGEMKAEPLRLALHGESGTVIGRDHHGHIVLAAYQPLEGLDMGLVAKKNLAEIRGPYLRRAAFAAAMGALLVLLGGIAFRRAMKPLVTRLERSEARYAQLVDQAAEGIVLLDAEDRIEIANPRVRELFGVDASTPLVGMSASRFLPADVANEMNKRRASRQQGESEQYELNLSLPDRERRLQISAAPVHGPDGRYEGRLGLIADITEAYRARQMKDRERRLLRDVLNALPLGVGLLGGDGRWRRTNPMLHNLWGTASDGEITSAARRTAWWSHSGEPVAAGESPIDKAVRTGEPQLDVELVVAPPGGGQATVLESVIPLDAGDEGGEFLVVDHDVSTRRAMERLMQRNQELLYHVLENIPAAVAVVDEQGLFVLTNRVDQQIWGEDRLGKSIAEFRERCCGQHEKFSAAEGRWPLDRALGPDHETVVGEIIQIRDDEGESRTFEISAAPMIKEGELWGGVELAQDKTTELRTQAEMRRLSEAVIKAGEAILILDAEGRIEYANPAFESITGYPVEEARGRRPEDVLDTGRQPAGYYDELWQQVRQGQVVRNVIVNRRRNGEVFYWDKTLSPLFDARGELVNVVVTANDITALRGAEEQLYRLAREDPLTELPNQAALTEWLRESLPRVERGSFIIALALVDISGFARINDALGYVVGDAILKELAHRLKASVREGDLVARINADTFAVALSDVASEQDLPRVLDRLEDHLSQAYTLTDQQELLINHNIGVARAPVDASTVTELFRCAHNALDMAKGDPVSTIRYYASDYGERATRQLMLEAALRRALTQDVLELYFQPQIDLATGRLRSLETLLRWHHPELGWISPAEFIPLAERANLIGAIDEWVLEHALRQRGEWLRAGFSPGVLAINLSGKKVADPLLVSKVRRALEAAGCEPSGLELEITETAAMARSGQEQQNLRALREMGIGLVIDDFGTGYSSLSQLSNMPIDVLKIDRSFVQAIGLEEGESVVQTILSLAHTLGMGVIAEGIETPEQLAFLTAARCDFGQGFLFAKPMPAVDLVDRLERSSWLPSG